MVLQRAWNFVKRHRKKFLFSTLFAGGAYVAWRVWAPKIYDLLLQRLLRDSGAFNELLDLARSGDDPERAKRARFTHKQQVSDSFARRGLAAVRARHNECFNVAECSERLKEAKTVQDKKEVFQALQVECLAKALSALYTLHAILLLHRVEFNIVGREMAALEGQGPAEAAEGTAAVQAVADAGDDAATEALPEGTADAAASEDEAVHAAFIDSTRYLQAQGVQRIADVVRRATSTCAGRCELTPQTQVTVDVLQGFFVEACQEASSELLAESHGAAAFLPESIDEGLEEVQRAKVKRRLDEARDYLESPQFVEVFQVVTRGAAGHLVAGLGDAAADPTAAPLADGRSCPMAKLFGQLIALSNTVLDEEKGEEFIKKFAEEPAVTELCEAVYFQEKAGGGGQ